ncbi:MAG: RNA methyltransferase [Pseudomonadota bacterium]|nr:RNA methyltransferase [Pseudomonadota bacterium]
MTSIRPITSAQNPALKFVRSLEMKKYRDEHKAFVVEGLRHVLEGLACGWILKILFCTEGEKGGPPFQQALREAQKQRTEIYSLPPDLMQKLTHRDNAQGIVGVFEQKQVALEDIEVMPHSPWVALESIKDLGNLGTIIRTLDSVGPHCGIILAGNTCDPYSLECVRASMGSLFSIPVVKTSEESFFTWARNFKGRMVGTHLKATMDYRAIPDPDRPTILLMGNEQSGLPDRYLPLCTSAVKIPMRGRADSLNLSIATGVMLYELVRNIPQK